MNWKTELYIAKLRLTEELRYSKSLNLEDIKNFLEIKPYVKKYEDYIKSGLLYFTEDLNILAQKLSVDSIHPKGLYIMGIYGGELKKGEEEYAGLVLKEYKLEGIMFRFKLHNTDEMLVIPSKLLDIYGVKVYKMIYVGEINPFRLNKFLDIILSQHGTENLRSFLRETLKINKSTISIDTYRKIGKLIDELRQPSNITTLNMNKYYVIYRRIRTFTASILKPTTNNLIIKDEVGYVECKDEHIAYYYSAILNYLSFKVIESKRAFIRTQYGRPLLALYVAGLYWKNVDDEIRTRVVDLSKKLHERAPTREYKNQRMALKDIAKLSEFKDLLHLLDSITDKGKLEEALNLVSSEGPEQASD